MRIRCQTCGEYIDKGTKINPRKEDVVGENCDYVIETGASSNFESWRSEDESVDKKKRKRDEEEMNDAMKSLENRTSNSKQEIEMKSMKSRHAPVTLDAMIEALNHSDVNEVI
ncbi:hypothetical protein V2J09_005542 [Rumex salicifolius]